jgi:glycogen synthase
MTLRVLHCIYDDPANPWVAGGGAVRVREIYRRLLADVKVTVATGSYPGARDEQIEGIRYQRLGARSPYAWSRLTYGRAASGLLRRGDYDAAVFDFSTYTPVRLPRGRPVGVTVHHLTGESARARWGGLLGPVVQRMERRMLRQGRFFSATSLATRDRLRSVVSAGAEIRLIQAGVDDALFELRRRESDYLLFFGRLDWFQKGLDVLLDAVAILARERPGVRLRIAGRGKHAEQLLSTARSLGIRDNVELIGPVSDEERSALFAGARALLMPSRFEGFGMAAAEAMAAGVPVVASNVGSLPEVVHPPEGGVVVPAGDAEALAAAAGALLDDPASRRKLSRTARRSAERFRWDRVAEQHLEFLQAIKAGTRDLAGRSRR